MSETEAAAPLRVAVIIGSTREGRVGDAIGGWFITRAQRRDDLELRAIDLAGFQFPARYPNEATPPMTGFAAQVGQAEAFVIVTPEYNHSFPASLKQAIDYAYDEWRAKPVGFVSYGYRCAGMYAVEHLRAVFTELHAVTMRSAVALNLRDCGLDSRGDLGSWSGAEGPGHAAEAMLDQLVWWGLALRAARATRPYVA
jgi:NAD(P)H-dependent FMN reductase